MFFWDLETNYRLIAAVEICTRVGGGGGGGGGTPTRKLDRYVPPDRARFLRCSVLK